MLDVQRYRGVTHREEIEFTRKFLWGHLILGAVVIALFLFHELFRWFAGAVVWYALSLMVMYGFMNSRSLFRWLQALVFLAAAGAGLFFILRVFPTLEPQRIPLIPHSIIPLWVGLVNLVYSLAGIMMVCNPSIRRAGRVGFTLW